MATITETRVTKKGQLRCWLTDRGPYGWSGTRIATEEDMESIYRAMRILDAGLAQLKRRG